MFDLYENIKSIAAKHGYTPGGLCSAMGISRSTLSNLKNGRAMTLSVAMLERIAAFLGEPYDVIAHGSENKEIAQTDTSLDDEIIDKVHRINESDDTREMLDALMHRSDLRALLHMGKDATPEQIEGLVEMLRRFKGE